MVDHQNLKRGFLRNELQPQLIFHCFKKGRTCKIRRGLGARRDGRIVLMCKIKHEIVSTRKSSLVYDRAAQSSCPGKRFRDLCHRGVARAQKNSVIRPQ